MRWTVHATRYNTLYYIRTIAVVRVYRGVCSARGPRTVIFLKIYRDEYHYILLYIRYIGTRL